MTALSAQPARHQRIGIALILVAVIVPVASYGIAPCLAAMKIADFNEDKKLDRHNEYLSFLNLVSGIGCARFEDLPRKLQNNYNLHAVNDNIIDSSAPTTPMLWEDVMHDFCGNSTFGIAHSRRVAKSKERGAIYGPMVDKDIASSDLQAIAKSSQEGHGEGEHGSPAKKHARRRHKGRPRKLQASTSQNAGASPMPSAVNAKSSSTPSLISSQRSFHLKSRHRLP